MTLMVDPLHPDPHPLGVHADGAPSGGTTVTLRDGTEFTVEEWWDRVGDGPWAVEAINRPPVHHANRLCAEYAERVLADGLPADDEVLYGNRTEPDGRRRPHLVHVNEVRP